MVIMLYFYPLGSDCFHILISTSSIDLSNLIIYLLIIYSRNCFLTIYLLLSRFTRFTRTEVHDFGHMYYVTSAVQ